MLRALKAEFLKLKRAGMPLWTALVVLVAPLVTVSMVSLADSATVIVRWGDFMRYGPQLVASWYGAVLFGLVTAYLLGREYGEDTEKQMFTLPLRREYFFAAKMAVLAIWIAGLLVLSVAAQAAYATVLGLPGASWASAIDAVVAELKVAVLIYATLPWVALVAMIGRGYVAPLVYSAITAALGLGLAEAGWGRWFPWSMPLSVTGVALFPSVPMPGLVGWSWALIALVFVSGSAAAIVYVDRADNTQ
jgi:ABC-2 type transport system permease protein